MNNIETNELMPRTPADGLGKAELPSGSNRLIAPKTAAKNSVAGLSAQPRPTIRPSALKFRPTYRHWGINE